jgi:hypothetical protein
MLEDFGDVSSLSFSVDGLHLQTDRGSFRLHSHVGNVLSQSAHSSELFVRDKWFQSAHSSELLVRDKWIAGRNVNLLWLPHEHRAIVTAVFGDVIVIGHKSGRISMFEFSF